MFRVHRSCVGRRSWRFEGAASTTSSMAMATAVSTSSPAAPQHPLVDSTVHQLEVACAELKSLHETRAVYEKRGAIFFRTTVKAAARSQQQELEKAKARAKKAAS